MTFLFSFSTAPIVDGDGDGGASVFSAASLPRSVETDSAASSTSGRQTLV